MALDLHIALPFVLSVVAFILVMLAIILKHTTDVDEPTLTVLNSAGLVFILAVPVAAYITSRSSKSVDVDYTDQQQKQPELDAWTNEFSVIENLGSEVERLKKDNSILGNALNECEKKA